MDVLPRAAPQQQACCGAAFASSTKVRCRGFAAVDRGDDGEYITRSAGRGADFVRLRGLAFPTSNGVNRPGRKTSCGRES